MAILIALAVIVFFVVGIVYLFIYVNTPNQFNPNSVFGRMENRFKREQEQWLYSEIVKPVLALIGAALGLLILLGIAGCLSLFNR